MELKGRGTEKNLEAAFTGELQTDDKHTYFDAVAKEEGFEQIVAIFLGGQPRMKGGTLGKSPIFLSQRNLVRVSTRS